MEIESGAEVNILNETTYHSINPKPLEIEAMLNETQAV